MRIDVMLRTPGGVKGLRSFESDSQSCSQLLEAASLSLSIAVMDALAPLASASASAAILSRPALASATSPAGVVPPVSSASSATRPPPSPSVPAPSFELALGPAVVSGWSPSFTGAAALGWARRSSWGSAGLDLRLLPPKRQGEGAAELEVQSISLLALLCARVDALGFCGVVLAGGWSGGPIGAGETKGVVGAGGQLRVDGNLSERVGIRAFVEVVAPLLRPTFMDQSGGSWRLPAASVSVGTLMTFHFL
jgi:hypothetical protein